VGFGAVVLAEAVEGAAHVEVAQRGRGQTMGRALVREQAVDRQLAVAD